MTRFLTRLTFSCLAAALAGCAAGNTFAPAVSPAAPAAPAMRGRGHSLTVRIRIPKHRRPGRGARYISAATKGMTLAITGASTLNQAIDLTPKDPRCTGTTLVCTIAVPLAPGAYSVAVTTYDLAPVGGAIPAGAKQLSIAHAMPLTVTPAKVNTLNVTLDGVPASIVVGPLPQGILGTAFVSPTSFPVVVKDADGYTIVGTYSTPIVLTDSDASGNTTVTTTQTNRQLFGSNDVASIAYNGKAIASATIGASAGIVTAGANFTATMPLYVSDTMGNTVKLLTGSCALDSCGTTIGSGFSHPVGLALDASGNLFVADFLNNAVKEIPVDGSGIRTLGSGYSNPADVAVDSNGNVFVSDNGNYRVKEIVAVGGAIPASSPTITTLGGFSSPFEIALDASGDVFVADAGGNAVREIEAVGGVIPMSPTIATIGSGFNGPSGVAVDAAGNVFVADIGNNAVKEVLAGTTTVITLSSSFQPYYVKLDQAGNLYASDNLGGSIAKYAAVNGTIPASPVISTFASGFNGITGFVVPR